VAPLLAPTVPPGFLPLPATTAAPPTVTNDLPPRIWPASPVAYVRREVGVGAAGTRGASRAALSREVGAGTAGTRGALGAVLRREAGAGAQATHGGSKAALSREVGARSAGTHGAPGAALSQEVGARTAATRGGPGAALSWETGTAPPPPLPRLRRPRPPQPRHQWAIICMWYSPVSAPIIAYTSSRRCNCGDVSSSNFTFDLFSSLTVCGAPVVTAGDARVYLVGYIFCIIDCHICQDIFGRMDIIYYRLPYVSRDALSLKTLVLYIYRSRDTMQYNQQLYAIYSSYRIISHPN
jgi:hypothetical protein